MPSSVVEILKSVGLEVGGVVRWGESIKLPRKLETKTGVYIISLSSDANAPQSGTLPSAPIDITVVEDWISQSSELCLDGHRPTAHELADRLRQFWLPDESILYIGRATVPVSKRVGQYYRTPIFKSGPHAGGRWIKALSNLKETWVFWCITKRPIGDEKTMVKFFADNVSAQSKSMLYDSWHPLPFANIESFDGLDKNHGITRPNRP